jgi:hypothetical protein
MSSRRKRITSQMKKRFVESAIRRALIDQGYLNLARAIVGKSAR